MSYDVVNNPKHYVGSNGIECIDTIEASMSNEEFRGYLKGTAIAYLFRYDKKELPLQDLEKAEWYIQKLKSTIEDRGM